MSAVIHLLDVGDRPYGDSALLTFDTDPPIWVLVDCGHRTDRVRILSQLTAIAGHPPPFHLDLIIISHAHDDHVGSLPELLIDGEIAATHALIPDIGFAFGPTGLDASIPDAVSRAVALLREEPVDDNADVMALEELALDAVALRDRYATMLSALAERGCRTTFFGSSPASELRELERSFRGIGFKILGPSQRALTRSRDLLFAAEADAVSGALTLSVDGADTVDLVESLDASKRLGHLINAQSIVCTFSAGSERKVLFAGDFQFADLGTADNVIRAERDRLVERIASAAPYAFAKLSHHGSNNAVGEDFLNAIGDTDIVGIICGHGHPAHPDPETLALLDQREEPSWVRTDRSGHIEIRVTDDEVSVRPADALNIVETNQPDARPTMTATTPSPAVVAATPPGPQLAVDNERIVVEIPARASAVTIRLDLLPADTRSVQRHETLTLGAEPAAPSPAASISADVREPSQSVQSSPRATRFEIAAGRDVGNLLFLTDTTLLADYVGPNAVSVITAAITFGGHELCDVALARSGAPLPVDDIAALLLPHINEHIPDQVVILGGYDVIPAKQIDTIAPETPEEARAAQRKWDPDSFVVWSDDTYVDFEGAGLPDLPISRIPDAHDALFTLKTLQATPPTAASRSGVRNSRREFVAPIFATLPGAAPLLVSGPALADQINREQLRGSLSYYMLHGSDSNAKVFWGERSPGQLVEAVTLDNLPTDDVDIAVLGCCWGALAASTRAADWTAGQPISGRLVNQSLALSLLAAGARAVIGCTGAHYSPTQPPFTTNAGPLHSALWERLRGGQPPARALFDAKYDFAQHIATITDANELAIANKTLSQFTCLGLGC